MSQLVPGPYGDFEEIEWFGKGFSTTPDLAIVIDESALRFDFAHPAVPGGTLNGTWRFLSTAPPECGPSSSVNSGSLPWLPLVVCFMGVVGTLPAVWSITAILVQRRGRKEHYRRSGPLA